MITFGLGVVTGAVALLLILWLLQVWITRRHLEAQRRQFRSILSGPVDQSPEARALWNQVLESQRRAFGFTEALESSERVLEEDKGSPGPSPTVLMDDQALLAWFGEHNCCPDCGGTEFIEGPHGGSAVNMLCATCHSEFCMAPPFLIERIGEPKNGRLEVYGLKPPPEA